MAKKELKGRDWIEKAYLPEIDGIMLIVGVCAGTVHYPKLAKKAKTVTIDIDPQKAQFGGPEHLIEDFLFLDPEVFNYDHISIYGLDPKYTPDGEDWLKWSEKMLNHADALLSEGGTILFGGYMGKNWEFLRNIPALKEYSEIYFKAESVGPKNKPCVKWWIKKPTKKAGKTEKTDKKEDKPHGEKDTKKTTGDTGPL